MTEDMTQDTENRYTDRVPATDGGQRSRKMPHTAGTSVMKQLVAFIISKISPERIILFGSYARGDNRKDSDVDILIIIKNLKNERQITGTLYKELLKENISVPVDFLAIDYNKYNRLKNETGYIYKTIEREGLILYGK
jgi:predicted nucleotidyltransferase